MYKAFKRNVKRARDSVSYTCPKCNSPKVAVINTRYAIKDNNIRRRRSCLNCNYRWSTLEIDLDTYNNITKLLKNLTLLKTLIPEIEQ